MASFGKKKPFTEYFYSKVTIFILSIVGLFLAASVYERYTIERLMSERRMETEIEKNDLIERKQLLEEKVEYLSGDRGIEEEIRKNFDVAKEGEKVIILVGEEKEPEPISSDDGTEVKKWYQFWR